MRSIVSPSFSGLQALHAAVCAVHSDHQAVTDVRGGTHGTHDGGLEQSLAGNGGMKAFMAAHEVELKGALIVELEALGAGELTLIDKEGTYVPKKASSRMKRLVRKAGQATGLKVPEATMEWRNSASAYALKHGQQALHLAGMDGRKPAFFAEEDDVIENIDNDMLALNSDFVMEVLKHI